MNAPGIAGGGTSTSGAYTISWTGVAGATGYNLGVSVNGGGLQGAQYNGATSWSTSGMGNASYAYQEQACNAGGGRFRPIRDVRECVSQCSLRTCEEKP